jgi:hypothetical protein
MFEYHGWATLRDYAGVGPDEFADDPRAETVDVVRLLLDREAVSNVWQSASVTSRNGCWQVEMQGVRNHRSDAVLEVWHALGQAASGSYGLLYVHDDEDPRRPNEWAVYALVRGKVTVNADPFLSPFVPRLEDPWVPEAEAE